MKPEDLDLRELLLLAPDGGELLFGGQRVLLVEALALGLLRAQLVELLGTTAARGVLSRFGYAHGWITATALEHAMPWDSPRDWQRAGGRLHRLQGLVSFEPMPEVEREPGVFAAARWRDSYEAEQHLTHLGPADEPVCWSLCGFASGYLSAAHGARIVAAETMCVGRGDPECRMVARHAEAWGDQAETLLGYLERDCLEADLRAVQQALVDTEVELARRRARLRHAPELDGPDGLVARSRAMRDIVDLARRVARVDTSVLVTGESGVGKERIARLVHDASPRASAPFVAINCGALSETLLESELFGHARGAFTGATSDRVGLLEAARGGTLFLDEIGEVSAALQVKLLRVLQERELRRLGENESRSIDVRIVAATWRDPRQAVAEGRLRQDFYYRLRVVELHIPPLRERRDDILALAHALLEQHATRMGVAVRGLDRAATRALLDHPWPGNVRELGNAIERGVALAQGELVTLEDLPPELRGESPGGPPLAGTAPASSLSAVAGSTRLADVERALIAEVLERTGGNKRDAARQLGIGVATLYRRLQRPPP